MKTLFLVTIGIGLGLLAHAQDPAKPGKLPLTITVFSESVSMPNFRNLFKHPNLGVRIGTELYYSRTDNRHLLQTINLGYYYHKDLQNGFYLTSEFGYRRFFNNTFVDLTAGLGYLVIDSALPRYKKTGNDYQPIGSTFGRIMPTLGLGAGYKFKTLSVFSRYELFGEMPFGYKGVPVLPHKVLHVGTRFNLK